MRDGFITVATATPTVSVADCAANVQAVLACIGEMAKAHAKVMVLPELCLTGYTCSDLFWQVKLLDEAEAALAVVAEGSREVGALILVGMPLRVAGKLLNVAAVLTKGFGEAQQRAAFHRRLAFVGVFARQNQRTLAALNERSVIKTVLELFTNRLGTLVVVSLTPLLGISGIYLGIIFKIFNLEAIVFTKDIVAAVFSLDFSRHESVSLPVTFFNQSLSSFSR